MSLFNKEPSSDSETENRVTKKMKGAKGKGRGQSRSKGMIRKKVEDRGKPPPPSDEPTWYSLLALISICSF